MEKLTPTERAVFVLREAFGYSHREIAGIASLTEANSRQLHARARRRLARPAEARPVERAGWRELVERFLRAAGGDDLPALEELLTEDVRSLADGGGRTTAARKPVSGRERVARYLVGAFGSGAASRLGATASYAEVNGAPAVLGRVGEALIGAIVLDVVPGGRIAALHILANPDKLGFAAGQLSHPVRLPGS